jgi:hypothetical protein
MDRIWSGVPWLHIQLGAMIPAAALAAVAVSALVVGWFRRRIALTAALLAMPMCASAELIHRSV